MGGADAFFKRCSTFRQGVDEILSRTMKIWFPADYVAGNLNKYFDTNINPNLKGSAAGHLSRCMRHI